MIEDIVTICEFCHQDFTPAAPGITTCLECFQQGRVHEPLYPVLLRDLRAVVRGLGGKVGFTFVGDGDFALEVRGLGLYPIIVATIAEQTEDGRWTTRPAVPDPGQPWAIALFRHQRQWPQHPEITKLPATDAEVVAFVTAHQLALDVFAPGPRGGDPVCAGCGGDPCFEDICLLKQGAEVR